MPTKFKLPANEGLRCEFKEWPIHADDLSAAIVAFANTEGGRLFLGVDDAGAPAGVADPSATMQAVDNVARNNCLPPVTASSSIERVAGKSIVVVEVPRGHLLPYRTNRGVYYVRTSTGRRQASQEELLRMFQRAESLYYDELPVEAASVADLDAGALEKFFLAAYGKRAEDFEVPLEKLLANLRVTAKNKPTIAGLLLFGRNPQQFLPYAQINAACFPGQDLADAPIDRKDLGGSVPAMLDAAGRFIGLHLRNEHVIKGFEPETRREIPEEAIREALVNSLIHRDYTVRGPNRLLIFKDRVEIHSAGRPPNNVDVEAMRLGTHVARNPILLSHMAKLGFVTAVGSGIPRILKLVEGAAGRAAEIEIRPNETVLVLPRQPGKRIARRRNAKK